VTSFHGIGVSDSTDYDVYVEKCYGCTYGYAGLHDCRWISTSSSTGNKVCKHSHIWFGGEVTDSYTAAQNQQVACHEVGHSVGLMHGAYECMRTDSNTGNSHHLGSHNEGHINGYY